MRRDPPVYGARVGPPNAEPIQVLVRRRIVEILDRTVVVPCSDAEDESLAAAAPRGGESRNAIAKRYRHWGVGWPKPPGTGDHIRLKRDPLEHASELGIRQRKGKADRVEGATGGHAHRSLTVLLRQGNARTRSAVVVAGAGVHIGIEPEAGYANGSDV